MHGLTLLFQIFAAVSFFIGWMNWQIPKPPHPAWNWTTGGFFWLLVSFMVTGVVAYVHTVLGS